ncbi:MAG: hypothetical protein HYU71_13755 [Bacteroidetes bacterium]|nr:hypothetical protein [Bacteroidota bacterium]
MAYEKRVVAFIDILGFKNSIEKSNLDEDEFERILQTLTELKQFFITPKSDYRIQTEREMNIDTQIIQISDSLVISRLVEEQGGIYHMLTDCAFAIHLLIEKGFLCRGAIKVGNMYHKDTILFGEAYIKAYLAESEEHLPIIKFEKDLFEIVKQFPTPANEGFADWEISFIEKNCKQLMTGIYYLDYFTDYDDRVGGGAGTASVHYSMLRDIISKGLQMKSNSSVYEKYRWAADQFNKTAKQYNLQCI